jgi:hypothetical protein
MGHERVGYLPKTKRWLDLIKQIAAFDASIQTTSTIATQTLENVKKQYETLFRDDAVKIVFTYLVTFSRAFRFPNPRDELNASGIHMPDQLNLLAVVKSLHEQMPSQVAASEYGQLAIAAAADAIGRWYKENDTKQTPLFKPTSDFLETCHTLGSGAGFCELARLYFGSLTERYLNYFLDRASSATISDIQQREKFQNNISTHVDDVSKHAFETAKITQSFAAGWYNTHTREKVPNKKEIEGFLSIAFGKLRDELRREGESK